MKINWPRECPHLAVLAGLFLIAVAAWRAVPDKLPVHWNLAGEVDRYGGKFEGLLFIPVLAVAMYAMLLIIPFIDPRRDQFARFEHSFTVIRWSLTLFLTAVYGLMLAVAMGQPIDFSLCLSCLMGLLFIVLGFSLKNVKSNWFVGVRTPWTLSSETSWTKTHQQLPWVFLGIGLSFFPLGWFKTAWMLGLVLTVALGGIGWLLIYSYLAWKRDPRCQSPESGSA